MREYDIMKVKRILILTCGLIVLSCAGAAFGDGCVFVRHIVYEDICQPTQKVSIRWDGSEERLLIQTKYEGPAEEMVWVVPIPSEPVVESADGTIFEDLSDQVGSSPDFGHTRFVGFWPPEFGFDHLPGGPTAGGESPVAWRRRIGDYDVVLLRPVDGEDVIGWLNTNEFPLPEKAGPILEDYIRNGWWTVASRIHPDALTDITRDNLAKGTLHPLEMTFQSAECVYPLRLTGLAAGPVEELIYIEGPAHYVPVTLPEGDWEIDIVGGPIRQVPQHYHHSDIELAVETADGETLTKDEPCLTKLRRVFQPEEMTEDLVFGPMDYSEWLESENPLLIGLAATQYGRRRDPNGIAPISDVLSSGLLEQVQPTPDQYQGDWLSPSARILNADGLSHWTACWGTRLPDGSRSRWQPYGFHVYGCVWALGEIGIEHPLSGEAEELLLDCTRHDNQIVRMEAYVALTKLRSPRLGPILVDRLAWIPDSGPASAWWDSGFTNMTAEMNIVADWIVRFGTDEQKAALAKSLTQPISGLQDISQYSDVEPEDSDPWTHDWFEWVGCRAANAQNAALIGPLQALRAQLAAINPTHSALDFVLRAETACGSADAMDAVIGQIIADEDRILTDGHGPAAEEMTSLSTFYVPIWSAASNKSLRTQIVQKYWFRHNLYPMPSEVSDAVFRSALAAGPLSDFYALYLLAGIKEPQEADRDRLKGIWDAGDTRVRLVATDVLYVWDDRQTLLSLCETTESDQVESEIVWALAELGESQAIDLIEEQVFGLWNADWLACGRPFMARTYGDNDMNDPIVIDAVRKAEAVHEYLHPQWESLDDTRLALLVTLAGDRTIHPGFRFHLLVTDHTTDDWARPLLEKAAMDVLEAHPDASTVHTIQDEDTQLVIDACAASGSDEFRKDLLLNLLKTGYGYYMPVIEGLLWEVWPQRYTQTEGQSVLFLESRELATALDYYSDNCHKQRWFPRLAEDVLESLTTDESLPAGYRAFLLVHWLKAPSRISQEFVEALLQQDMPGFIKEALQQRLLNWS